MNQIIVGMGEALWDVLPEGKKIGGAPANFAYHVSQFGFDSRVVSAIGDDNTGIFKFRQRTKIFDFRHFHLLFTCCISANSATSDSVYPCRNLRIAFKTTDTFAKFIPHFLCCFAGDFFILNHPVSNHGNHISIFFHQTIDIYFHRYTLKCFLQIYHIHQLHTILIHRMIVVVSKEILYPVRNRKTTMFIE